MTLLIILGSIIFLGLGVVAWLLIKEKPSNNLSLQDINSEQVFKDTPAPKTIEEKPSKPKFEITKIFNFLAKKKSLDAPATQQQKVPFPTSNPILKILGNITDKLKIGKKKNQEDHLDENSLPPLKDIFELDTNKKAPIAFIDENNASTLPKEPQTGTMSLKADKIEPVNFEDLKSNLLSKEDEKNIDQEINAATELSELKQKYEKLDELFKERSAEYEKTKTALDNEQKIRKEFNKVKDILEKELSETKEKARKTQADFISAQAEGEGYKKRISQIEEKVNKLEKEILAKEKEIDNLVKRLQTFASPTTAATPPVSEQKTVIEAPTNNTIETPQVVPEPIKEPPPAVEPEAIKIPEPNPNPPTINVPVEPPAQIKPEQPISPQPAEENASTPKKLIDIIDPKSIQESNAPEQKQNVENISPNKDVPTDQTQLPTETAPEFLKLNPDILKSEKTEEKPPES